MEKQTSQFVKSLARGARSKMAQAKRTYTCRTLKELIKAYRACTTAADERALVKKESAHIRDLFKEGDKAFRRRNIAKLLFFHMNGYPTNFGMTECVKLCATEKFADKRVAYLGLMILVEETEDILMLVTNSLKRDLQSPNDHIVALALTVLSDLASEDMARDLLPEIEMHVDSANAYIRKKAALASVRTVRKLSNEETPNILAAVPRLFETRQSPSHISGTALVLALARQGSGNTSQLRASTVPVILTVLRDLLLTTNRTRATDATVMSGVRNPFLQVKIIHALRVIARGAPREAIEPISDVLAQVASNTDSTKLLGTAVLYECVKAIIALNTDPSLRTMAVTILGRFLSHKDPNVRYIALQELAKVVVMDKNAVSIEKYRKTITDCLREADPSIKHRALDLLHAIAVPQNATDIATELIEFLAATPDDDDLRESAARKLFDLTERFSPSAEWRCATVISTLAEVDTVMPEPLVASFVAWVSAETSAHAHAAKMSYVCALLGDGGTLPGVSGVGAGATQASTSLATVVDPFENLQLAVPAPPVLDASAGTPAESATRRQRRVRLERVALFLFGEYGDLIIDATGAGTGGISSDDAISAIERVLGRSGVEVTSFSSTSFPCDPREDEFAHEVCLVREAAMAALVKLAARLTYMASGSAGTGSQGLSRGASVVVAPARAPAGGMLALEGPQAMLALENGSPSAGDVGEAGAVKTTHLSTVSNVGLGTDMLASLGISESPPTLSVQPFGSGAMVPAGAGGGQVSVVEHDTGDSLMLSGDDVSVHPLLIRALRILAPHRQSMDVETQQRACEYSVLLRGDMASLRAVAFSRMPPMDYDAIRDRIARFSAGATAYGMDADAASSQAPFSEDLLSLLDDDVASSSGTVRCTPAIAGPEGLLALSSSEASAAGVGEAALDDLLGRGGAGPSGLAGIAASTPSSVAQLTTAVANERPHSKPTSFLESATTAASHPSAVGEAILCESASLKVSSVFYKPRPEDQGETRVELTFANKTSSPFSKFVFQLAVPKYIATSMQPASSSSVPSNGMTSQVVILANSLHGTKPVQLRYRIQYEVNGEAVLEQGSVAASELPSGL
jgi:Adaptin N terminal region/Adaptin C-terminal domain